MKSNAKMKLSACIALIFTIFLLMSCKTKHVTQKEKSLNYIPYYLQVYKADSLFLTKNHKQSYDILDKLFKRYKPLNQDLYYEYETYVKSATILDKKINYKNSIEKLVGEFGKNKLSFVGDYKDSILAEAFQKSKLKDTQFDSLKEKYAKSKNILLRDSIIKMAEIDQMYRYGESYVKNAKKIDSIENINEHKLIYIFNNYGYPGYNIIGNPMMRGKREKIDIGAIIIHMADRENSQWIKEKLLEFIKQGRCSTYNYAALIDREKLNKKEKQVYNVFSKNEMSEDIKQVNKERKKVGMPTIEYENWRNNLLK